MAENDVSRPPPRSPSVSLRRRFYKEVAVSPGFGILLDNKSVKTPLKAELVLPTAALASAVAAEWAAQDSVINPHAMPLTKLANTAIDRGVSQAEAIRNEIISYAANDLVCYRVEAPAELVLRQSSLWDPVLSWASRSTGVQWLTTGGLRHVPQRPEALRGIHNILPKQPFALVGCHALTTISGSALLALMLMEGSVSVGEAWRAACVEEQWQREQWGEDDESAARHAARWHEFQAAAEFVNLVRVP